MVMNKCDVYADFQSVVVRKDSAFDAQRFGIVDFMGNVWDFLHECTVWTGSELEFVGVNFEEKQLYIQYVDESSQAVPVQHISKDGVSAAMLSFAGDILHQRASRY